MPTGKLRASDLRFIDDLFDMGGGYVLDFSNQTFAEFFADELGVAIYDPRWDAGGTSKAKRLRYFLRSSSAPTVLKTLRALWEYREAERRRAGSDETVPKAEDQFYDLIERLGEKRPRPKKPSAAGSAKPYARSCGLGELENQAADSQSVGTAATRVCVRAFLE